MVELEVPVPDDVLPDEVPLGNVVRVGDAVAPIAVVPDDGLFSVMDGLVADVPERPGVMLELLVPEEPAPPLELPIGSVVVVLPVGNSAGVA